MKYVIAFESYRCNGEWDVTLVRVLLHGKLLGGGVIVAMFSVNESQAFALLRNAVTMADQRT